MSEILDVIHKTIYQFFDVCGDDEEVPMSDKDKLLLEVNKAICNNIKALEQDSESEQFAKWVAREIFDDDWDEYNKDAFEEIACRKLAKLGIVRANGDNWELIEPQESEDNNCPLDKLEQRIERIETIILALECALPSVKYVSSSHKSVVKLAYEAVETIKDERLEKLRNETRINIDKVVGRIRDDKEPGTKTE